MITTILAIIGAASVTVSFGLIALAVYLSWRDGDD